MCYNLESTFPRFYKFIELKFPAKKTVSEQNHKRKSGERGRKLSFSLFLYRNRLLKIVYYYRLHAKRVSLFHLLGPSVKNHSLFNINCHVKGLNPGVISKVG